MAAFTPTGDFDPYGPTTCTCPTCGGSGYVVLREGSDATPAVIYIPEPAWASNTPCDLFGSFVADLRALLAPPRKYRPPQIPFQPVLRARAPERAPRPQRPFRRMVRGEGRPRRHSSWYTRRP